MKTLRAPGRPAPRPRIAGLIWFLALILASGCGSEPVPVLGAAAGEDFLDGIRLALADDEEEFGPLPPLDTLLVLQGSARAASALEKAEELVEAPGLLAVIGHASSPASLASSQVYNRAGVVQIAPTSTAPLYSQAGAFSFRMVPSDHHQGRFLAHALPRFLPEGGRVAVLYVNDDYGRGLRESFLQALDRDLYEPLLDLPHTEGEIGELDVAHHMDALESVRPDMVAWLGRVPGLAALLPGLRERVGPIPVLGGDGVARADLFTERGPEWAGVHYADFIDVDGTPGIREVRERFQARFGADAGASELFSYDAARMVLAAVREGVRTPEDLRDYLLSLGRERPPFSGVTGPIQFNEVGDVETSYVLRTLEPRPAP